MNSIPLIKGNTPQEINTSIIALKKALSELEAQDRLLQGTDKDVQDKIKQINELIEGINTHLGTVDTHLTTIDGQIIALQPVDTVTSGNMHSVTSNAVFWSNLYQNTLNINDTRNENYPPSHYLGWVNGQHTHQEFKLSAVIGTPFNSMFCTLITISPWVDFSGGRPTQFVIDTFGSGEIKYRNTVDEGTWSSWYKIANQSDLDTKLDMIILDGIVSWQDFENALNANDPRLPNGFHGVWLRSGSWAVAFYLKTMSPQAYCGYLYWTYTSAFVARFNTNGAPFTNMSFNP